MRPFERKESGNPALKVTNLRLKFPGTEDLQFRDLSISIDQGEKILMLGPSGCGKSTLLQVLSGLIPDSIEVPVRYDEIVIPERWGFVFQDPDTQFCMPYVDEEIAFVLENLNVPHDEMPDLIDHYIALVGLRLEDRHTPIQSLSQGMKQRLAIASTLALEPDILFLDEPTALLDPEGTEEVWETIKQVCHDKTLIIVEHKIDHILDLVDRIVLFNSKGEIVADGPRDEVFNLYIDEIRQDGIWYPGVWEDYVRESKYVRLDHSSGYVRLNHSSGYVHLDHSSGYVRLDHSSGYVHLDHPSGHRSSDNHQSAVDDHTMQDHSTDCDSISTETAVNAKGDRYARTSLVQLEQFQVFRGKKPVTFVEQATLQKGEWIAIVGQNGAGKSTLLQGLMQLIHTEGNYRIMGKDVSQYDPLSDQLAFVFQNPEFQFVTNRTWDEIAYTLKISDEPEQSINTKVEEMLHQFDLEGHEEQHPYQLSMGQKRRLSVASAVVKEQPILLLDEPTFGQDARNTFAILEKLEMWRRKGTTILMITHDLNIVRYFASGVWLVEDGKVILYDDPENYLAAISDGPSARLASSENRSPSSKEEEKELV